MSALNGQFNNINRDKNYLHSNINNRKIEVKHFVNFTCKKKTLTLWIIILDFK